METIGIFGGAGCIGSHIVKNLLIKGYKIIVMDDLSSYPFNQLDRFGLSDLNFEFIKGSILNKELVDSVVNRCDRIIQLVSLTDVGLSIKDPNKSFEIDIIGNHNVLKSCMENKIKKLVFASSASVYGSPIWVEGMPPKVTETDRISPISNYANVKFFNETQLKLYYELYGFPTTSLRYFSVYGKPQLPKEGSFSWNCAIFTMQSIKGKPITVFGTGNQCRDYTHISDIAEATVQSLFNNKTNGKVFNVGTGIPTTVKSIAYEIKEITESRSKIVYSPQKKGDPFGCVADNSLMKKLLGWTPKVDINKGLKDYILWIQSNKNYIPRWLK